MGRTWLAGVVVVLAAAGSAEGQQPDRPAPVRPQAARAERVGSDQLTRIVMNRRARLGVKVSLQARATDSIGAYLDAVTPGGPAAIAGLRAGDVITRLAGNSVLGGAATPVGEGESVPGLRLIELAARLAPNDTIALEYRRGDERRTTTLVTAEEPDVVFEMIEGRRPFMFRVGPGAPRPFVPLDNTLAVRESRMQFIYGTPLGELVLAPLNPDLGRYFGTADGVLVIDAAKGSSLGLKGGDVVLAVDGRKPASPGHLLRILQSYDRGESFRLEIMRNKRKRTVAGSLQDPGSTGRE